MAVTAKCLFQSTQLTGSETSLYVAPAGTRTIVDKFSAINVSASPVQLTVRVVASGNTAGATYSVLIKTIQANETYTCPEIVGQILNPGDFLSVLSATASAINVRGSGREVS